MEVKLRVADPAGNITIFVTSPVERNLYAKVANELLAIKEFRGEQVGFIERHEDGSSHMEMMGGEFCGNATRSFGYLLGKEQESKDAYKKTVTVDVSGSSEKLDVEVDYETGKYYKASIAEQMKGKELYRRCLKLQWQNINVMRVELCS